MTIEIKLDASALHSLIGDDEKLKLGIINGVLNTYAKNHIKSIANSDAGLNIARTISQEYQAEIERLVGKKSNHWLGGIELNSKFEKELRGAAERKANTLISEIIDDVLARIDAEYIQARVDRLIRNRFNRLLDSGLEKEMKAKIDKALEAVRG